MSYQKPGRKFYIIILFLLVFGLYLSAINPELSDLSGDSARFLLLTKSIASGRGFKAIEKPGNPPHLEYMPGLPLTLAPVHHFWPQNLEPMKLVIVLFAFSASVFFYLFLFREPSPARLILAAAYSFIPFLFKLQTQLLADLPHLAFVLLAFFLFEKARDKPIPRTRGWILAGLAMAAAFYFRQIAVVAFAAGIIAILASRNLRRAKVIAGFSLGFAVPASLWYLRNFLIAGAMEPSYGKKIWFAKASNPFAGTLTLPELVARIFRRIEFFSIHLSKDMLLGPGWPGLYALWILLLVFLVIGLGYELVKQKNIASIFFLPYLAAVSSWEGWVPRYLLPLLPLALFFIYRGMELVTGVVNIKTSVSRNLVISLFCLWAGANIWRSSQVISFQHTRLVYPSAAAFGEQEALALIGPKNFAYYPEAIDWKKKGEQYLIAKEAAYYHFFAMAEWARKNLRPDDVVVCRKPSLFAYQSRGKAVQFPPQLEVDRFLEEVKKAGGKYVLIEEISLELRPVLFQFWQSRSDRLKLKKQIRETYLLEIR